MFVLFKIVTLVFCPDNSQLLCTWEIWLAVQPGLTHQFYLMFVPSKLYDGCFQVVSLVEIVSIGFVSFVVLSFLIYLRVRYLGAFVAGDNIPLYSSRRSGYIWESL